MRIVSITRLGVLAVMIATRGGSVAWADETRQPREHWQTGKNEVLALAFTADGRRLATGDGFGEIALWQLATKAALWRLDSKDMGCPGLAFTRGGETLAAAGAFGGALLLNAVTGKPLGSLCHGGDVMQAVRAVAISPDGNVVVTAGFEKLLFWDFVSRKPLWTIDVAGGLECLAFSPDGKTLASGGDDGMIRLWDPGTGRERTTLKGHTDTVRAVAFSADGKTLVSGGHDNTVRLWDAVTARERSVLKGHTERVYSVAISPDGQLAASAAQDGRVLLWDVANASPSARLAGPAKNVIFECLAFAPDGKTVAGGGTGGTIAVWDVPTK